MVKPLVKIFLIFFRTNERLFCVQIRLAGSTTFTKLPLVCTSSFWKTLTTLMDFSSNAFDPKLSSLHHHSAALPLRTKRCLKCNGNYLQKKLPETPYMVLAICPLTSRWTSTVKVLHMHALQEEDYRYLQVQSKYDENILQYM